MKALQLLWSSPHNHKLPSAEEMRSFEAEEFAKGVKSLTLMEKAGEAVVTEVLKRWAEKTPPKVAVLCGPSNNGGDGLVAARLLGLQSALVQVVFSGAERLSADCEKELQALDGVWCFGSVPEKVQAKVSKQVDEALLSELLSSSDIVLDALLGTGQKSAPREPISTMISLVNKAKKQRPELIVVSVDMPTGISADTGSVFSEAIQADLTVTFQLVKRGLLASEKSGEIVVSPIGIESRGPTEFTLAGTETVPKIPKRPFNAHKHLFGPVLVIGGSSRMPGAPLLTSRAALRSGAGLVRLIHSGAPFFDPQFPELMYHALKDEFIPEKLSELVPVLEEAKVVVIGPGLGDAQSGLEFAHALTHFTISKNIPCVVDADALKIFGLPDPPKSDYLVITPHPGEAAHILKTDSKTIQNDRFSAARELSRITGGVAVLKGSSSIVYARGLGSVISEGNAYMATAGSGDVLAGVIGALIAQGMSPKDAAITGAFAHAAAGEAAHGLSGGPIIASDITDSLPKILGSLYA